MYRNCNDIGYVCRKYHISRTSLWRWNKKYDGSKESLEDKSHRPLSKHPKEHTETEIKWIKDLIKRNPHITLNEIWYKLKINKGYARKPASLYRVLRKIGYYNNPEIKGTSKKHNQKYHTPTEIGKKWQIDVKYVPKECKTEGMTKDINYYQYTCIDEASRERYLYWYEEHSVEYTVDFVKRCISYYEYKTPLEKNNPILIGSFLSKFLFHIIYKYTKQSLLGLCLYLFNYLLKPYFLLNLSTCPFLAVLLCVPV